MNMHINKEDMNPHQDSYLTFPIDFNRKTDIKTRRLVIESK